MKKERIAIIVLVILLAGETTAWVISDWLKGGQWIMVADFEYNDFHDTTRSQTDFNTTTGSFQITNSKSQIMWQCQDFTKGSHFDIIVYDVHTNNVIKEIVTNTSSQTLGTSDLNSIGTFYLRIFIDGTLYGWQVSVNQYGLETFAFHMVGSMTYFSNMK
jgi:hypothetical protein